MKALRYLLIAVTILSMISVRAQENTTEWGRLPEAQMQSTSVMQGSGSTLPSAAMTGVSTTYSPAHAPGGPRKGSWNPGGEPGPDEGENSEPWQDPIGDAALPLALLALGYAAFAVVRRKRHLTNK